MNQRPYAKPAQAPLPPVLAKKVEPAPGAPPGSTPPDPRKLRDRIVMALIASTQTGRVERADAIIAEAEKLVRYILEGASPDREGT